MSVIHVTVAKIGGQRLKSRTHFVRTVRPWRVARGNDYFQFGGERLLDSLNYPCSRGSAACQAVHSTGETPIQERRIVEADGAHVSASARVALPRCPS